MRAGLLQLPLLVATVLWLLPSLLLPPLHLLLPLLHLSLLPQPPLPLLPQPPPLPAR